MSRRRTNLNAYMYTPRRGDDILRRLEESLSTLRQKTSTRLEKLQEGLDNWRSINKRATEQLAELKSIREAALSGKAWVPNVKDAPPVTKDQYRYAVLEAGWVLDREAQRREQQGETPTGLYTPPQANSPSAGVRYRLSSGSEALSPLSETRSEHREDNFARGVPDFSRREISPRSDVSVESLNEREEDLLASILAEESGTETEPERSVSIQPERSVSESLPAQRQLLSDIQTPTGSPSAFTAATPTEEFEELLINRDPSPEPSLSASATEGPPASRKPPRLGHKRTRSGSDCLDFVARFVGEQGAPPADIQELLRYAGKELKYAEARDALAKWRGMHPELEESLAESSGPESNYVPSFIRNESDSEKEEPRTPSMTFSERQQSLEASYVSDADANGRLEEAKRARLFSLENATAEITDEHRREVKALCEDQVTRRTGGSTGAVSKEAARLQIKMKKHLRQLTELLDSEAPDAGPKAQEKAREEVQEVVHEYLRETNCILTDKAERETTLQLYNPSLFQGLPKPQQEALMGVVLEGIRSAPELKTVKVCMGTVDNASVEPLVAAVAANPAIENLVLDNNVIRDEGFEHVLELVRQNRLKSLSMENQTFELSSESLEKLIKALEQNTSLTRLGVTFREASMRMRAQAILKRNFERMFRERDRSGVKTTSPEETVLQYNGLDSETEFAMVNDWGLSKLSPDLKMEIYCKLVQGIRDKGYETIRITNSKVDNLFVDLLCSQLQRSSSPKTLILDNNEIHGDGWTAIANLLEANSSVENLQAKLQKRQLDHESAERIIAALEKNKTILKLDVDLRQTHDKDRCERLLKRNWKLKRERRVSASVK